LELGLNHPVATEVGEHEGDEGRHNFSFQRG
jgi:hypothetical protein